MSETWLHGYKILNADRTSVWASWSRYAVRLHYPVGEIVRRPEGCGPLSCFAERWRAQHYLALVQRSAKRYDPRWTDAIMVPILWLVSDDADYWGPVPKPEDEPGAMPSLGSGFADAIKCLS